jgi:hypothetical protein
MEEGGSMKIRFEPYKLKSKGCRAVADHLGVLRTTPRQVRRHGDFDVIINWGSSQRRFPNARYINDPEAVAHASDKKASFESKDEALFSAAVKMASHYRMRHYTLSTLRRPTSTEFMSWLDKLSTWLKRRRRGR